MIADRTGPWPHYLVHVTCGDRLAGSILADGACLHLARGYLTLIGRRNPLSSTRRRG